MSCRPSTMVTLVLSPVLGLLSTCTTSRRGTAAPAAPDDAAADDADAAGSKSSTSLRSNALSGSTAVPITESLVNACLSMTVTWILALDRSTASTTNPSNSGGSQTTWAAHPKAVVSFGCLPCFGSTFGQRRHNFTSGSGHGPSSLAAKLRSSFSWTRATRAVSSTSCGSSPTTLLSAPLGERSREQEEEEESLTRLPMNRLKSSKFMTPPGPSESPKVSKIVMMASTVPLTDVGGGDSSTPTSFQI
mmetsp:Transcript_36498/g.74159  ORF Transcript_36498/g.74159 Transcript_36498/m.74159 type:complete len:247 (+) Transcript_36498:641-1381(+)